MHKDEIVSFRMSWLSESLNYEGNWKVDTKMIFMEITWVWSRIVDETPVCDRYFRNMSGSPSNKRITQQKRRRNETCFPLNCCGVEDRTASCRSLQSRLTTNSLITTTLVHTHTHTRSLFLFFSPSCLSSLFSRMCSHVCCICQAHVDTNRHLSSAVPRNRM